MTRPAPWAAALLVALLGCSVLDSVQSRQPTPGASEGAWGAVRRDATRRHKLYDGLIHRATATATHLGLAERQARTRRLAEWQGWTQAELDRALAADAEAAAASETFLVAFYTAETSENDLDAPRSIWRVAVRLGDQQLLPARIRVVGADATVRTLYPYVGTFDTVYEVQFPTAPDGPLAGRPFVLDLASARGRITLDYGAPLGVE